MEFCCRCFIEGQPPIIIDKERNMWQQDKLITKKISLAHILRSNAIHRDVFIANKNDIEQIISGNKVHLITVDGLSNFVVTSNNDLIVATKRNQILHYSCQSIGQYELTKRYDLDPYGLLKDMTINRQDQVYLLFDDQTIRNLSNEIVWSGKNISRICCDHIQEGHLIVLSQQNTILILNQTNFACTKEIQLDQDASFAELVDVNLSRQITIRYILNDILDPKYQVIDY